MLLRTFVIALCIFGAAVFASAQNTASLTADEKPTYDETLAKRLGGNDNGMKNYVLVILKTGPKDASIKGTVRDEIFKGHMANIKRLGDEGKLALAGPFGDNDRTYRGLYIFNVSTVAEALKLAETDPAIKAGIFIIEATPWFGSAALMGVGETHKRITKTTP